MIIKTIANAPGITMSQLLIRLRNEGCPVSERTLAKDIASLKRQYHLLPTVERMRHGYILAGMLTIGQEELPAVRDALHAFGVSLHDPDFHQLVKRVLTISTVRGAEESRGLPSRVLRQKPITRRGKRPPESEAVIGKAISKRCAVSFSYSSPQMGRSVRFVGFPLFKVFHDRAWYVIVRAADDHGYYPCRIDRIGDASIAQDLGANACFQENVLEAHVLINYGWGMTFPKNADELARLEKSEPIEVRFDRRVAGYIIEGPNRHPNAGVEPANDGTGDVIFRIKLSDPWEFQHWVRSFGASARLIAPEALVRDERENVRKLAKVYGVIG